jgi:hypothetical protein
MFRSIFKPFTPTKILPEEDVKPIVLEKVLQEIINIGCGYGYEYGVDATTKSDELFETLKNELQDLDTILLENERENSGGKGEHDFPENYNKQVNTQTNEEIREKKTAQREEEKKYIAIAKKNIKNKDNEKQNEEYNILKKYADVLITLIGKLEEAIPKYYADVCAEKLSIYRTYKDPDKENKYVPLAKKRDEINKYLNKMSKRTTTQMNIYKAILEPPIQSSRIDDASSIFNRGGGKRKTKRNRKNKSKKSNRRKSRRN